MTDSHSGILSEEAQRLGIKVLPMPFYIGEKVYREGVDLSRDEFYDMLRKGVDVSTSQPSPAEVLDMWKEMLKEYEEIVYIPLSSALSGSCMAAEAMANEDEFAGKVFVVDNGRVAIPMHRSVLDTVEMAEKGYSAAEIKKILEETREKMTIYIGLSTLEYLKKGGRISSVTALAADVLNIKPVMHFSTGTLDTYQKCRGMKKSRKVMIDAMKHELETNFREEYEAVKNLIILPYRQRQIVFQRMFDCFVVFYFVMNVCGIFLKLPEFFIYYFFLVFHKTDDIIDIPCFICLIFEKFSKVWNGHTGAFKTVDAVEALNMFLRIDALSGSVFFDNRK